MRFSIFVITFGLLLSVLADEHDHKVSSGILRQPDLERVAAKCGPNRQISV